MVPVGECLVGQAVAPVRLPMPKRTQLRQQELCSVVVPVTHPQVGNGTLVGGFGRAFGRRLRDDEAGKVVWIIRHQRTRACVHALS